MADDATASATRGGVLAGRRALVTGGGSGIGLAIATRFAAEGAIVTICGRTETKLSDAVASIGHGATYVVADITNEDQITAAVAHAAGDDGLDICVANAGGSLHLGSIATADAESVRGTFELNAMGTFLTIKAASASMLAHGGGAIVTISSGAGRFPHRHLWAYGASKAAIDRMVEYAAEELAAGGVRVNSVQPGIIDDDLMAFITAGGSLMDDYLEQTPISRAGTPEEVAAAALFMVSDEASWITGETLSVDGGHHLRRGANYELLFG